jgi:hypothetical protein
MTRSTCHLLSLAGLAAVAAIAHAMALPASAVQRTGQGDRRRYRRGRWRACPPPHIDL